MTAVITDNNNYNNEDAFQCRAQQGSKVCGTGSLIVVLIVIKIT